ncbi:MAG: hypothetical protein H0U08_04265 [Actinobacteria bacterium]|nr:hypothetical protein [Actinomycetota bacterium]
MRGPVEIALFTDHVQAATSFYERLVGVTTEAEWPGGAIFRHRRGPAPRP